jgi:hypothetical protein
MARVESRKGARSGLALVTLVAAAAMAFVLAREHAWRKPPPRLAPAPSATATPPSDTLDDPLAPGRPAMLDTGQRPSASVSVSASFDWLTARPGFQYSLSSAERGANPCALPAADTSRFTAWSNLSKGRFVAPTGAAVDASGAFDLVMHFHGDELARRELALSGQKFVLYGLTLDPSESYSALFAGTKLLPALVREIERALTTEHGRAAHVRHLGLSAWSAGYMAVLSILVQPEAKSVDAVALIDGLHGPRGHLEQPLAPFVDFARRAEVGEVAFVVTHSSIDPPDFASTTEAAHYLLSALGARPEAVHRKDRYGLELVEYFSRGDFDVRGYAGNDKADHCAQVTLLRDVDALFGRRWQR